MIKKGIPSTILALSFFLAASITFAADGENIFEFSVGNGDFDLLSDNIIRAVAAGSDLDEDGLYEVIVTDYDNGGMVHVYEVTDDNTLEWVWSSAGSNGAYNRQVGTGDLDNDGVGEIIFVICDGTYGPEYEGGVHVYEWDGTDNGYGTEALSIYDPNPGDSAYFRAEGFAIGDVDEDGDNELVLPYNTSGSANDALYILSVTGDFQGAHDWVQEGVFLRPDTLQPFNGSPTNAEIGDMDGDGNLEAIYGIFDFASLYIVEATGPDTYEYQTYLQVYPPADAYNIDNFKVADLDNDGADEVYFNILGGGGDGILAVITGGADVSAITFEDNVTYIAQAGEAGAYGVGLGDQDHGPGTDGMDIYTAGYSNGRIYDHELTGTDPTDPASWTKYTLWEDLSGNSTGSFGISVPPVDMDGDGRLELVATYLEATPPEGKWFRIFEWAGETEVTEYTIAVDVPREFKLAQNYPNPFNAQTTIEYTISRPGHVSLKVFNAAGQLVRTLVDDHRAINRYAVTWDGADEGGYSVASGVYFYQLKTSDFVESKKMTLLK